MGKLFTFTRKWKCKADFKLHGPGIIGGFGRKGDQVRVRSNSIKSDLNDLMPPNKIFRRYRMWRNFTCASNEDEIPHPLFSWPTSVISPVGNPKCDFAEKRKDMREYGYEIGRECAL